MDSQTFNHHCTLFFGQTMKSAWISDILYISYDKQQNVTSSGTQEKEGCEDAMFPSWDAKECKVASSCPLTALRVPSFCVHKKLWKPSLWFWFHRKIKGYSMMLTRSPLLSEYILWHHSCRQTHNSQRARSWVCIQTSHAYLQLTDLSKEDEEQSQGFCVIERK